MNKRETESKSSEPGRELNQVVEKISFDVIFEKIDECEKKIKEIVAEYLGKYRDKEININDLEQSVRFGRKVFDLRREAFDFVKEYLKEVFEYADVMGLKCQFWAEVMELKKILQSKWDFTEIRSKLEKLREKIFPLKD